MKLHYQSRKYTELVEWIACNDGAADNLSLEELAGTLTVTMLAHCYHLANEKVAEDVLAMRERYFQESKP